jgi:hypothetical protein
LSIKSGVESSNPSPHSSVDIQVHETDAQTVKTEFETLIFRSLHNAPTQSDELPKFLIVYMVRNITRDMRA